MRSRAREPKFQAKRTKLNTCLFADTGEDQTALYVLLRRNYINVCVQCVLFLPPAYAGS